MDIQTKELDVTVEDINVVVIGDFNPRIFHPMWFAHYGLLRVTEAEEAKIEILHQDVSAFAISWLTVQVLRDRFTVGIKADVYQSHLNDLVQGIFQLLSHTPVRQLGINVHFRLRFRSEQDWHNFGHFLAPKSPWKDVVSQPGLRGLQMQGSREDERPGLLLVSLQPDLGKRGDTIIQVNDHYEMPKAKDKQRGMSEGAVWAVEVLRENYNLSIERARDIVKYLTRNFLAAKTVDNGG